MSPPVCLQQQGLARLKPGAPPGLPHGSRELPSQALICLPSGHRAGLGVVWRGLNLCYNGIRFSPETFKPCQQRCSTKLNQPFWKMLELVSCHLLYFPGSADTPGLLTGSLATGGSGEPGLRLLTAWTAADTAELARLPSWHRQVSRGRKTCVQRHSPNWRKVGFVRGSGAHC